MSAKQDISKLLDEWMRLTLAEGSSIQTAAWDKMKDIQAEKARLQKLLDKARHHWELEQKNPHHADFPFRTQVSKLLSLEERNQSWLCAQMKRAAEQKQSLNEAFRNLQKIQRSYARKRQVIAWQCLS
jgi:hypothetical protein